MHGPRDARKRHTRTEGPIVLCLPSAWAALVSVTICYVAAGAIGPTAAASASDHLVFAIHSTIVDMTSLFIDNAKYTYLIYGTSAAPTALLLPDGAATPSSGQFTLIVPNAAFGSGGLDFYVTTPGASLDNMSPNLSNIQYSQ